MPDPERQPILDTPENSNTANVSTRSNHRKGIITASVIVTVLAIVGVVAAVYVPSSDENITFSSKAERVLKSVPLIDGHNDLAFVIRNRANNQLSTVDLRQNLTEVWPGSHTDIPRLRKGMVGGQFWSCYVSCNTQYKDAVRIGLDQCDLIRRFIDEYPDTFLFVDKADDIQKAFDQGFIASMIGLEGGHKIDSSMATLHQFYRIGVRYLTLTHTCNTPWADSSPGDETGEAEHAGLTDWGKVVIKELNRLGMLVDLSHVSKATMLDALEVTQSPVIFSHSSAWSLCHHHRNVQDDVLLQLKANNGVIMVNFYPEYINCPPRNSSVATVKTVADHIDYIRNIIGIDHVGIGADYDGVGSQPQDLEDVSKYPNLFKELFERGWHENDLKKLAGQNIIRVFKDAERVRDQMAVDGVKPYEELIPSEDLPKDSKICRTGF